MKKKIGIDFTYIINDQASGIRKYGEEILDGLRKLNTNYEIVLFVNESLKDIFVKKFPEYKIVTNKFWFNDVRYIRRVNSLSIMKKIKGKAIKNEKCDIMIYPYVGPYTAFIDNQRQIISILDLIPLDEIEDKTSPKYEKIKKENIDIMKKSKYITTLSKYSKKRLNEINPSYKGEIIVISSSVAKPKDTKKNIVDIIKTEKPYIFSINSFFKHKNQITLVKAFNNIKEKINHKLVLVGRPELGSGKSGYNDVLEYIEKNNLKDRVIILSNISDEDRNAIFYNADLFVTTSLMEGFGRTPIEAAICKVPVISTRETALPEATMNEAFYYDNATDDKELSYKILQVLENKPAKEKLEEISKKLTEEYSEEKIARQYMDLIDKILEGEKNAKN